MASKSNDHVEDRIIPWSAGIGAVIMMFVMGPGGKPAGMGAILGGAIGFVIIGVRRLLKKGPQAIK